MLAALLLPASVDFRRASKRTSHKIFGPTAYPVDAAPFSISSFGETFRGLCPALERPRAQGLATLSAAVILAAPTLEASFSPQRPWASPFGAFLPRDDRRRLSLPRFRPCTLKKDPKGLSSVLRRVDPISRAVSLNATRRFSSGQDRVAPLGFWTLQASPRSGPGKDRLPLFLSLPFLAPGDLTTSDSPEP